MKTLSTVIIMLGCLMAGSGCSSGGSVVILLPDDDGRVGKIEVRNNQGALFLDKKNASASFKHNRKPEDTGIMDENDIKSVFKEAMAAQPPRPATYFLNFYMDSENIVPDSIPVIQAAAKDILSRPFPLVLIRGHADRSGSDDFNMDLSRKRALKVKALLMEKGIAEKRIRTTFHGEHAPLIRTGDHVPNLWNRRVEILVR